jgi:hypothetical protein
MRTWLVTLQSRVQVVAADVDAAIDNCVHQR